MLLKQSEGGEHVAGFSEIATTTPHPVKFEFQMNDVNFY